MSAPKTVSDLPKPRLDDYRPLDLFLAPGEGEDADTQDVSVGPAMNVRLLDGPALEDAFKAMDLRPRGTDMSDAGDRHLMMETGFRIIEALDRMVRETIAKIATRRLERHGAAIAFGDAWDFARDGRKTDFRP